MKYSEDIWEEEIIHIITIEQAYDWCFWDDDDIFLKPLVKDWLKDNKIAWIYHLSKSIRFLSKDEAMLFKLTWG